ncbi:MAG: c-type cytochrome [Bacteroidetes bacterium]|nr:c-type cytochrome [Bacteroidota bacterium]
MHNESYQRCKLFLFLILILSLGSISGASAQDGEALFKTNCAACHAVKDRVVGPALQGIENRRSEEWLLKWVKNSQDVVKSGDEYAVKLFNDFNKVMMPSQNLKDDEIKAILAYVKKEAEKVEQPAAGAATSQEPEETGKNTFLYLLIGAVLLLLVTSVLRRIQHMLARTVRQKEGLPEQAPRSRWQSFVHWARHNKKLVAVILILMTLYGSGKAWYGMQSIGISQGYTPDQPIKFSHQVHSGTNAIACVYCHSGAEKGKTAGVPSANVCMNCHKFIKKGPLTGTVEIAKIYKALDYDPDKGTYGPNPKPIQWVRVHNLPDLSYFNHSQHFVVGKIACQTCHGPVQDSMTVASQYSPLTMGWCINCHRTTQVKMTGNAYYNEYHKEMSAKYGSDSLITVEKIGGTECARCHY